MPPSRRHVLTAPAAVTVLALGALAEEANAAPVVVTNPCVKVVKSVDRSMPILGGGFAPNSTVAISYVSKAKPTPTPLTSVVTNADGDFSVESFPVNFSSATRKKQSFTLIASDPSNPALTAIRPFEQVDFGYEQSPAAKRPGSKTRHTARGFEPGKTVYLHLRYKKKTRRTVKIGVAEGACGIASKRMRGLPTTSRVGTWKYYVDQSEKFSRNSRPQVIDVFEVTRTLL